MTEKEYKKELAEAHESYKKLAPISCPHLDNEKIVFNRLGFNHLVRKGNKLRPRHEVLLRLSYLQKITHVISSPKSVCEQRVESYESLKVHYWGLTLQIEKNLILRVVVRQINSGPKHFFSIMQKNKKKE